MSQGRPIQKHGAKRSSSTSYTPSLSSSSLSSLSPSSQSSVSQTHLATSSINHSHTWIVSNSELVTQYRYKPKLYLESPFFIAGERRWQLRLFPFGDKDATSPHCSLYLYLITPPPTSSTSSSSSAPLATQNETHIVFRFLCDKQCSGTARPINQVFDSPPPNSSIIFGWGRDRFALREDLFPAAAASNKPDEKEGKEGKADKEDKAVKEETKCQEVKITVELNIRNFRVCTGQKLPVDTTVLDSKYAQDLRGMIPQVVLINPESKKEDERVCLQTDDGYECRANQALVMARCGFISKLFKTNFQERESRCIHLNISKETLELLLVYFYTGQVKADSWTLAALLLRAADMYEMDELVQVSCQILARCVAAEHIGEAARLVLLYQRHPQAVSYIRHALQRFLMSDFSRFLEYSAELYTPIPATLAPTNNKQAVSLDAAEESQAKRIKI